MLFSYICIVFNLINKSMENVLLSWLYDKKVIICLFLIIVFIVLLFTGYIEVNITIGRSLDNFIPVEDYEFKGL